ncbi:MAG: glycosyltransferase family 2 protein [Planctomycetota bacterium]
MPSPTADATLPAADVARIAVIVPAFNEEASLPLVLGDLPAVGHVVVVDNNSTDATAQVATECGATVIEEPRRGYGSACLAGIRAVKELQATSETPPEVIVFLDGDYSDHPEELPMLVAPLFAGEADLVLGSRLAGDRERGAMPPQSVWGNRLACFLMRLLFGARYTDLGPFRAIRIDALNQIGMVDTNFGWTIEMQIKAVQHGLRVQEIPVRYRRRVGVSKISGTVSGTVRAGTKILWTVARYGLFDRSTRQPAEQKGAAV